jgi:hypothetical protein
MSLRESHGHTAGHLTSLDKWKGDEVCVCCETKRNRSTSSSVRRGKEHSRSRSGWSFNFAGDKRVGTSRASAKKKKRGERTVGEKLFPLFLIKEEATRHTTEKKKKRAAEKKEMGERLVSPFFFSIHQLPLFLIEQLCVEG